MFCNIFANTFLNLQIYKYKERISWYAFFDGGKRARKIEF